MKIGMRKCGYCKKFDTEEKIRIKYFRNHTIFYHQKCREKYNNPQPKEE